MSTESDYLKGKSELFVKLEGLKIAKIQYEKNPIGSFSDGYQNGWNDALSKAQELFANNSLKDQAASDMMFLMSYVYDDLKSKGTRFAKDPMLMVGQVWSVLHKRGFRVIDIGALETETTSRRE